MTFLGLTFPEAFVFPGGSLRAWRVDGKPGLWHLELIWDKQYGKVDNQWTEKWAIKQIEKNEFFTNDQVNELWNNLNGKEAVDTTKEYA